jgi:hypothetical protein
MRQTIVRARSSSLAVPHPLTVPSAWRERGPSVSFKRREKAQNLLVDHCLRVISGLPNSAEMMRFGYTMCSFSHKLS